MNFRGAARYICCYLLADDFSPILAGTLLGKSFGCINKNVLSGTGKSVELVDLGELGADRCDGGAF